MKYRVLRQGVRCFTPQAKWFWWPWWVHLKYGMFRSHNEATERGARKYINEDKERRRAGYPYVVFSEEA